MAKTMYKNKWIKLGEQIGREHLEMTMQALDRENRKPAPKKLGVRRIILEEYKKTGIKGAMLAIRMYNKRANSSYTWKDVETWIKEEEKKEDAEHEIG